MRYVTYFVRDDAEFVERVRQAPDLFWKARSARDRIGNEFFELDTGGLSWLLSSKRREELKFNAAFHAARKEHGRHWLSLSPTQCDLAIDTAAKSLGFELLDATTMADDLVLIALEGRGFHETTIAGIGSAGARLLTEEEVGRLSEFLNALSSEDLRTAFDQNEMERVGLGDASWTTEPDSAVDRVFAPRLEQLKAFFARAWRMQQNVLVVHETIP